MQAAQTCNKIYITEAHSFHIFYPNLPQCSKKRRSMQMQMLSEQQHSQRCPDIVSVHNTCLCALVY